MTRKHFSPSQVPQNILRGIVPTVVTEWADTALTNASNITDGNLTTFANAASTEVGAGYAGIMKFTLPKKYPALMFDADFGLWVTAGTTFMRVYTDSHNYAATLGYTYNGVAESRYPSSAYILYDVSEIYLGQYVSAASTANMKMYSATAYELGL